MGIPILEKLIAASLQVDLPIKLIAFVVVILFSMFWVIFSNKKVLTLTENRLRVFFKIINGIIIVTVVYSVLIIAFSFFYQFRKNTPIENIERFNDKIFGILIIKFNNDSSQKIQSTIRAVLNLQFQKLNISDVEVKELLEKTIKSLTEARKIGKLYNAKMVIWGDKTLNGIISNVTLVYENSDLSNSTSEVLDSQINLSKDVTIPELTNNPVRTVCYVIGIKYYNEKVFDTALKYLIQALEIPHYKTSDDVSIYYLIGNIYLEKNNPEKALEAFNRAIDLDPKEYRSYSNRAVVLKSIGKFDEAELDFNKALGLNKTDPMTYMNLGNLYRQKHLFSKAIENYDKALLLSADYQKPNILINKGVTYWTLGNPDEAINMYMKAIKIKSNLPMAYRNIGSAYIDKKDYDQAIKYIDIAIKLEPDYANAYVGRSTAHSFQGKTREAVSDISKAIELDPNFENYIRRGELLSALKKHDEALNDYSQALKFNPTDSEALNNRGSTFAFKQEYNYALHDFKKAIETNPQHAKSYYHLALTYKKLDKFCESLENYERFYSLANPNDPENQSALLIIKNEIEMTKSRCLNEQVKKKGILPK